MIKQVKLLLSIFVCFFIIIFLYSIFVSHKHLGLFLNFPKYFLKFFLFEFWDIYLISSI